MKFLVALFGILSLCALRAKAQVLPYRQSADVLRGSCLSESELSKQIPESELSALLSNIATQVLNGTGKFVDIASTSAS